MKNMRKRNCVLLSVILTFILTSAFFISPYGTVFSSFVQNMTGHGSFVTKKVQIDSLMKKYFIKDYNKSDMEDAALYAYTASAGDPYTVYISREEYEAIKQELDGGYKGIGVEVYIDNGEITVISAYDDSPAAKSGILPGDKITAVDGVKASEENYQESINRIRGKYAKKGETEMSLTIKRGSDTFNVKVNREEIVAQTVKSKVIDGTNTGYLRISNFAENTAQEFNTNIDSLIGQNIKSLVIDLRDNPGGILDTVVEIADRILPEGTIVTIKDKQGHEQVYKSDENSIDLPICVLINSNSASASEVLSGAIRDFKKGTLIGETSFGKGLVQSIVDFGDNTAFKFTNARYYTPSGECIDGVGIKPDIEISLDEQYKNKSITTLSADEDIQLKKAVKQLN